MKNLFKTALLTIATLAATQTFAQTHKDSTVGKQISQTAKKVGHKTSELASKGAAAVTDKRYEGHWAVTGELVYIDENGKYFYVDKKGHRQFITKAQMRTTKP